MAMLSTMTLQQQLEAFFLIIVSALVSALIGLDRERADRPAGLRTHMLVGIGSCLFTILSIYAFPVTERLDTSRVASQILPGLGFLGAGAIIKGKFGVQGLTTAASLWATASVGMAVGTGAWLLGLAVTLIIWIVLAVVHRFEGESSASKRRKLLEEIEPEEQLR